MNVKMKLNLPGLSVNAKVNVEEVKSVPMLFGKVITQRGITSDISAAQWGAKNGVAKVYWFKSREQVYGVRDEKEQTHDN